MANMTGGYTQPSGPLADMLTAASAPAADEPPDKTKDELAAMTKEERTAYHKTRVAAKAAAKTNSGAPEQSKAEKKAQDRAKQEADRKRKEDAANQDTGDFTQLEELKLQGLTEEQAKDVLKRLAEAEKEVDADDDDDEDEDESLLGCTREWMNAHEQNRTDFESLRDFNLKVRFQGHVDSVPPDHLAAILTAIASKCFMDNDLSSEKQPAKVEKKVQPVVTRWSYMLDELYKKCDALDGSLIIVNAVSEGIASAASNATAHVKDVAMVGILMAIREECEGIADEDMLSGLKRYAANSEAERKVLDGFIGHLESELDGSDDDEESD